MSDSDFLEYWFQHPEVWFTRGDKRETVNRILFTLFGRCWRKLVETPVYQRSVCIENIIMLDQLTRNFLEIEDAQDLAQKELRTNSALFMSMSYLVSSIWSLLEPEQHVFILLPLRHTRKIPLIDLAINKVNEFRTNCPGNPRDRNSTTPEIYMRFLRAGISQKLELLQYINPEVDTTPASDIDEFQSCLDSDTRLRPGQFRFDQHMHEREQINRIIIHPDKSLVQYVSLSGGVDSMVLSFWLKKKGYDVRLLHLVYGNRDASQRELAFIRWWAHQLNVPLYIRYVTELRREQGDRQFYESQTRNIRFSFYRQVQKHCGSGPILLGHILDDLAENFVSNVMQGFDIKWGHRGMGETDVQEGVFIARPLYWTEKSMIYKFAEKYNIPYTINTTPTWSRRGRLRNELFPLIYQMYGKKALHNIIEFTKKLDK